MRIYRIKDNKGNPVTAKDGLPANMFTTLAQLKIALWTLVHQGKNLGQYTVETMDTVTVEEAPADLKL